jgi:RHS repeat-associated protein
VVGYSYNTSGSVSGITVNGSTLLNNVTYNADNHITGWQWSDGKPRTIGYDVNGMVSSYTLGDPNGTGAAAGSLRTLTRDSAGRITGYSHTNNGNTLTALDQGFTYDALNRLTSQTMAATSYGFTYDANGNRTSRSISGNTYTNTITSNSNRTAQAQDVTGSGTRQYDAAGNTTSDGTNTFTYGDRGRMSSATTPSGNMSMLYNGLEQRAYKSSRLGTSYYVRDESWDFLGEYDQNGNPVFETIYLGGTPVGVIKQAAVYNVHADQIDTPRVITKQDHTIVWRWDTAEAFGATAPNQDPSGLGAFVFNQCMPGQVRDSETGTCDNGHRTYDGRVIGGYLQPDSLGLGGGSASLYPYAGGNPLTHSDSSGLFVDELGTYAVPITGRGSDKFLCGFLHSVQP